MRSTPGHATAASPRRLEALSFALLWVPYALLVGRFWFVTDDAYIAFRYARNLARGHGLRFNLGEEPPVEGYSNFLWTLCAVPVEGLGLDVGFWMSLVSFLCGSVLLFLVFRTLRTRLELELPVAWLATLALACFPPFAVWSTGGLETMAFALALFVTFERLVLRRAGIDAVGGGLAALALSLVRVEGCLWAVVIGLLALGTRALARQPVRRPLLVSSAIAGLGFGLYYAWRSWYYGLPFPNTVYAKSATSASTLARGGCYLAVYLLTFVAPLVHLTGCATALDRRWRAAGPAVAAMALGVAVYAVLVGGDFMAMGRFLVPGLAFNALLFGLLLQRIRGRSAPRRVLAGGLGLAAVAVGLAPAFDAHVVPESLRARYHFRHNVESHRSEYQQWVFMDRNAWRWKMKGLALRAMAQPEDTLAIGTIGFVGYYSELTLYDMAGLVNHEVAMLAPSEDESVKSPGHDRWVESTYFLDRKPTYLEAKLYAGKRLRSGSDGIVNESRAWLLTPELENYVADFRVFAEPEAELPPHVLLVLRAVPPGEEPQALWRRFYERVQATDWEAIRKLAELRADEEPGADESE